MNSTVRICRLCLETIWGNDCDAIEDFTSRMLENLLKIDLNLSEDPLICKKCVVNLEKSVNFKTTCLNRESLNLRKNKSENNKDLPEDHKSCRFCMKQIEIECRIYLNETKENAGGEIADVIQTHIPELKFNPTEEVISCKSCLGAMQNFSSFVTKCLDVEDKISKYVESSYDVSGRLNLYDMQQHYSKSAIKYEVSCSNENSFETPHCEGGDVDLKIEIKNEEFQEVSNLDLNIKNEEIDIKPEQDESERFQEPSTIIKVDNGLACKNSEGITMYKCATCSYKTKHKNYLRQHRLFHKNTSEVTMLKCKLVPFKTKRQVYLKRHKSTHTSEIVFKCNQCPQETNHKHCLDRHKLSHKSTFEIIMFKCKLCPYAAKRRDHLKVHELRHKTTSEITMFKCDLCTYETKRKDHLRLHKLTHKSTSEVKMFKCELCSYETKLQGHLKRHKLTHKSTLEMFKCELCSYKTTHQGYIKRHKLTHESASKIGKV